MFHSCEGQSHKTKSQTTAFEEKGEPKQIRTEVRLLTSLTPYRKAKPAHKTRVLGHSNIYTSSSKLSPVIERFSESGLLE